MKRTLPSLHLISIFEAAARLQSFKKASEELFITPSAVSHQIKALEQFIGFELFIRKTRGVELNSAGKSYLRYVQEAFQLLEQGTKNVRNTFSSPGIKMVTFPTMAANVIIPNLTKFVTLHPEIDIRIETGISVADLRYEDFDVAIRVGDGQWQGVEAQHLVDIEIAAVCSPSFAQQHNLTSLSQLSDVPLIDLTNMENIWTNWLNSLGIKDFSSKHKLSFNNYDTALQAAEQGLGVALAMLPIEKRLLNTKVLVNPFDITSKYPQSIYAVFREDDKNRHEIQCFLAWLKKLLVNEISVQR